MKINGTDKAAEIPTTSPDQYVFSDRRGSTRRWWYSPMYPMARSRPQVTSFLCLGKAVILRVKNVATNDNEPWSTTGQKWASPRAKETAEGDLQTQWLWW